MKKIFSFSSAALALVLVGAGCASTKVSDSSKRLVESPTPEIGQKVSESVGPRTEIITINPDATTPKEITIKIGDTIEFRNSDLKPHWPASAPHPVHTDYPEFDPKKPIQPGDTWSFTFTKTGDWKFHDHIDFPNQTRFGVIHVK